VLIKEYLFYNFNLIVRYLFHIITLNIALSSKFKVAMFKATFNKNKTFPPANWI